MRWKRLPIGCSLVFCLLVIGGARVTPWSAVILDAQTHPCDAAVPLTVTVQSSATHKAQFCAKPTDNPEAFVVYTNGTASDLRPLTMTMAAGASGLALYEGPKELTYPVGTYQVQVSIYNRVYPGGPSQESGKSNPLSLSAVADTPPAAAPKFLGVIR